jgi:hypothetical protein
LASAPDASRYRSANAACACIELAPAMFEQLRTKPGSDKIGVTIGDLATTTVGETFTVAYLVSTRL